MSSAQATSHLVSVAIPVYNVERYLAQCLDSIQSDLGKQLQIIIVNDGSTDGSIAIAQAYAARASKDVSMPDVSVVTKANGGYGAAVNRGFDESDGLYFGIVEPDDFLDGDLFGELYAIAQATDMPDVVKSTYKRVWMPDTPEQRIWGSLLRHRGVRTWSEGCTDLGESPLLVRWHPSVWSAIYRRDFLIATNTRFIEAPGAGWVDNPFVMRAMCQASRIAYTDDAWYCYREDRPGSSSVTKAPTLSLTRWLQMDEEVAVSRWSTDEGVLTSLASIGFRYASNLWDTPAARDPKVAQLLERVLRAIPLDVALALDDVSPAAKQRYLDITKQEGDSGSAWRFRRAMLEELLYSWRENGLFFACERAGLHRHPSEPPQTPQGAPVNVETAPSTPEASTRPRSTEQGDAPLVSVIIPAYNVEAYVEAAVSSVLHQTLENIEVIVVDDGSRDETGSILDRMAAADERLTVLHVENGGAPAARNLAIDRAQGRYMVFVDADDECAPTMLERLASIMDRDECELAVCGFEIVTTTGYGNGEDSGDNTYVETKQVPDATYATAEAFHRASPELFDNNMFYPPWNKMFLSSRLNDLNIRYRDVFWDDFPFVLDYIRDVQSVSVTSEPLYRFFRRRADSETARYRDGVFEKREAENEWMRDLYRHWKMSEDPKADEMVSRRYVERLVGCVANECSPKNPKSFSQKRAKVAEMLDSPAVKPALKTARPRSLKMRVMLLPYRMHSATLCLLSGMFIEWVRGAAPTLFAKLKANR